MATRLAVDPRDPRPGEPPNTASSAESEVLLSKPFVLMLCVQFCFGLAYSGFFLLPKYLAREFKADADTIGAVAAAALLAGVAAAPAIGAIIDRGRRRSCITIGALVNGLCATGFVFVHTISAPIYLLRAVQGISYAFVFNSTATLAADLAPARKLSQAIGLCGAAGMVANAIAPALAEAIADRQGWRLVFWLAGAAALFAALLSLFIREPQIKPRLPSEPALEAEASALSLVFDRSRIGAFVCSAATGAGFGVMFTFTQPFALSLGASKVSSFFVGYTLCALAVRLFLGTLADNLGRVRIAFGALVLYGLVACMTSLLRPDLLFAVGACMGFAHGLLYPAINALAVEGVPRARRGAVMSYFTGCFYGGFALWVLAAGVLARAHGYPLVFLATGLSIWISVAFLPRRARGQNARGQRA